MEKNYYIQLLNLGGCPDWTFGPYTLEEAEVIANKYRAAMAKRDFEPDICSFDDIERVFGGCDDCGIY